MTLINIGYGSLASSETMNKNFSYLDDKISETSDSIMTTIASMLSSIATINSRLNEISGDIGDVNTDLDSFKANMVNIVKSSSMIPDWSNLTSIGFPYTAKSNGYVLTLPGGVYGGTLTVNNKTIQFKRVDDTHDASVQMVAMPIRSGDVINCTVPLLAIYFLPVKTPDFEEAEEDN